MKSVLLVLAAMLAWAMPASAEQIPSLESAEAELVRVAMQTARWTGPMLASNAETLPQGHAYTEPYFFDVISGGEHHPGSSGFYQYGLLDGVTIGLQPNFAVGANRPDRGMSLGDFRLLSQLRLTHYTPEHRIPTVAVVLQEVIPTGKHDHLGDLESGYGSGSFATEVGVNVQHYFLLGNGRLLRGRINALKSFPHGADLVGRSVYGTEPGFRGHARPGSRTTLIAAAEYSLTREWVLALDLIRESSARTRVTGRDDYGGPSTIRFLPSSRHVGFAPAIEYNWSDRTGILLGVWINFRGHNSPASVIPALALSRFW